MEIDSNTFSNKLIINSLKVRRLCVRTKVHHASTDANEIS